MKKSRDPEVLDLVGLVDCPLLHAGAPLVLYSIRQSVFTDQLRSRGITHESKAHADESKIRAMPWGIIARSNTWSAISQSYSCTDRYTVSVVIHDELQRQSGCIFHASWSLYGRSPQHEEARPPTTASGSANDWTDQHISGVLSNGSVESLNA